VKKVSTQPTKKENMLDTLEKPQPKVGKTGAEQRSRLTLDQARGRLTQLRKTAVEKGVQLPPAEIPKTLDRAKTMIADVERSLAGATTSVVPTTKPASTGPASSGAENLFAKASVIARKYKQHANRQGSGRPAAPVPSQAPEDMSRSQLTQAVENEKNHSRRAEIFHELQRPEKGQPSRQTIQRASGLSDLELERLITSEKDLDRRGELFTILTRRNKNRK
jgi:hypothetical protein